MGGVWGCVRRRRDYKLEEYGFDSKDMQDISDDDAYLKRAFDDLYQDEEEEADDYGYDEDED